MGAFDDLIPQNAAPQPPSGGAFDDLIPKSGSFTPGDYIKGLKRGLETVPGALTSLADLPFAISGNGKPISALADKAGEITGFQPSKWAKDVGEQLNLPTLICNPLDNRTLAEASGSPSSGSDPLLGGMLERTNSD